MPKFFVPKSQIQGNSAVIVGDDVSHISNVLRMGKGGHIVLCDGQGYDYDALIEHVSKPEIQLKINKKYKCEAEPDIKIVLFQALPKQGKMEHIIQKATELGVSEIIPVYSKRCVAKPSDKLERWQRVALEAAKQSGRGAVPEVRKTIPFAEAIKHMSKMSMSIMLYEREQTLSLRDVLQRGSIAESGILVGPEGGFEPSEALLAKEHDIPTVTLGRRILRTETAAAAVIPIIMYTQREI